VIPAPRVPRLQRSVIALLALSMLLSACTTLDRNAHADALAVPAHLTREQVEAGSFVLTAFARITRPDQPLTIYIEGDGLAWISRSEPSADPTPREATGLALAAADPAVLDREALCARGGGIDGRGFVALCRARARTAHPPCRLFRRWRGGCARGGPPRWRRIDPYRGRQSGYCVRQPRASGVADA